MIPAPRDHLSEVIDERRRWMPDWYTWLSEFVAAVTTIETTLAGKVTGPSSATDNAIARFDGATGKLVQNSSATLDDSGNVIFSGTVTTDGIVGTTTNDDAAAGQVGEEIQSTILSGSAVSLTSSVEADVTSISLTAGDWDVAAQIIFTAGAGTNFAIAAGSMTTTSATNDFVNPLRFGAIPLTAAGSVLTSGRNFQIGPTRFSLSSTTTVFLAVIAAFTVSTTAAYGKIFARRVR